MKSVVAALLFVVAAVATAQDAKVELKTGEKISGQLVGIGPEGASIREGDRLLRVRWEEVAAIQSAQPITLSLANGDRATLRITGFSEAKIEGTHDTFGAIRVPIASLAAGAESAPAAPPAEVAVAPPAPPPSAAPCCPKTPLCPKPLKGKIALSGTVRNGNVNSVLGALHGEVTKEWEEDKITAAIDALYGKTGGEVTAASLGGRTRWDHFFNMTFYGYASGEALYDDIQNLDLRAIVSIGVGDVLWKCSDDRSWAIEGGISALYEDFSTRDEAELDPAGRVATIYKDIFFEDLKFEETLELLVPLTDPSGYLARSRTVIGLPLCKDLALRFSLEITYQGDPPNDSKALDILGLVGVEYQF